MQPSLPILLTIIVALTCGCAHDLRRDDSPSLSEIAAKQALTMKGKPYRYGGNTPRGFDCSGLVQYSYAQAGVRLPHGTSKLRQQSRSVSKRSLLPGDLLFFNQEGRKSSHVAMYLGDDSFIHAPSTGKTVHISRFSDSYWRTHFSEARRVTSD